MKPEAVQVRLHDGTTRTYRVASGRDPREWVDFTEAQGSYIVSVWTGEGNSGTFRCLPQLAVPMLDVLWIRKVWSDPDPIEVEHFLEVTES